MVVFDIILGTLFLVCNGIILGVMIKDRFETLSVVLCIIGFVIGIGYFVCSIEEATQNTAVEALNGTLEYDTVSLDKNGKLLEIKIK